jgi:Hemerythrin HHE cation binding domain.
MAAATHNILRTLKAEHDELRALFEQMEQTSDRAGRKRTELLGKIEANLMPHAKWEETVFYPAFAERANREGLKIHAEAVEEHRAVEKTVIPDVHAADVTTPQFAGRVKVFGELIDHHARDEEKEMFAMARKLFTAQELAEFDEAYEEWKASSASTLVSAMAGAKTGMKAAVRKVTRRAQ